MARRCSCGQMVSNTNPEHVFCKAKAMTATEPGMGNTGPALYDDTNETLKIIHVFDGPKHRPDTCPYCKKDPLPKRKVER